MDNNINKCKFVEEPCRNFCILASTIITDPIDGREKMVFSNLAYKGIGNIIIIDTLTGEGEAVQLPEDNGAWALYNLNNERLLVGTCSKYGFVHCLELKSRKWLEPLRDKKERYIWNFTRGSDGKIYAGTWPGAVLLRYDPERHLLENLGKASEYSGNMYSRMVYGDAPGYIIISCCYEVNHVVAYDIKRERFINIGKAEDAVKKVSKEFICLSNENELAFYHPETFEPMNPEPFMSKIEKRDERLQESMNNELVLKDGRLAGIRGQEYFIFEKDYMEPVLHRIPTRAPATGIHTIIEGPDGSIWGSTCLGQTIFRYNPDTGEYYNSQVVCNRGGEVYGMSFAGERLFMSAYAGGDHIVYDITKPWNQINNKNPVTLASVAPKLTRPSGRSITGPDGNFWTGWTAKYGVYGGGISKIDINTLEMTQWYDPVKEQGIAGMDCDDKYIYFITNGNASGREIKVEPFHLAVWNPEGRIVWKTQFEKGLNVRCVRVAGEYVIVSAGDGLKCFKRKTMEYAGAVKIGRACTCMVRISENQVAAFCEEELFLVDLEDMEAGKISSLPGWVDTAVMTKQGRLFFAHDTKLYEIKEINGVYSNIG